MWIELVDLLSVYLEWYDSYEGVKQGWVQLAVAALAAYQGQQQAKAQKDAANQAGGQQPFFSETTREPYRGAAGYLPEIGLMANLIFQDRANMGPPPMRRTGGFRGPSPESQQLVDRAREQALGSTFVPQAQNALLSRLQGPNSMMNEVFQRAMSYKNPALDHMLDQGFSGQMNQATPNMQAFLQGLMGGQERLGSTQGMGGGGLFGGGFPGMGGGPRFGGGFPGMGGSSYGPSPSMHNLPPAQPDPRESVRLAPHSFRVLE